LKRYVLDSFALTAYFNDEKGAQAVADILKKALAGEAETYLSVVNWSEVYYIAQRAGGIEKAELTFRTIDEYPIQVVDVDRELALQAAQFKATNRMSLADAFAAALAKNKKAELLTGDPEFKPVENEINIIWI
jgi:ribonuclease VapC